MTEVRLQRWSDGDLATLQRSNTTEMTAHLGGPEAPEAVERRHARYLGEWRDGTARMFRIVVAGHPEGVGSIGYWPHDHHGEAAVEAGWAVESAHQGRGIATAALRALIAEVRRHDPAVAIYAFPRLTNEASGAICRKAGFELAGVEAFEYPRGHVEDSAVWVFRSPAV